MSLTTKAAVLTAPRTLEMRELPVPEINENTGLLRIEITGVCGVDWPAFTGERPDRFKLPLILGHEIVGRIVKIGAKAAQRWKVTEGDRVVLEEYAPCGTCQWCLSGHYYLCGGMLMEKMYGFTSLDVDHGLWGGFSQYVYLDPKALIHKIDEKVPSTVAPLYIGLANGIRWVQGEGKIGVGDTVVILGPGQLGLSCVIAAKEAGAACIIVTGRKQDRKRLELARILGAHHTIDVDEDPYVSDTVYDITKGQMADAVINVTSHYAGAAQQGLELAKIRGIVVMAGGAVAPAAGFQSDLMTRKEVTMIGVRGRAGRDIKKSIALLESGRHPLHLLSTHKFTIEQAEQALKTVGGEGPPDAVHVSVTNN
jgi:threonine dehydrogenase-like Zn-dependent dehydrogenase